jgi:hypothetical protein
MTGLSVQTVYVVLGTIIAAGIVARGLWRVLTAVHSLISALKENTKQTKTLSEDMAELREHTHRQLDHLVERVARLEGGRTHGREGAADQEPDSRRARGPGPHRGRGVGPV